VARVSKARPKSPKRVTVYTHDATDPVTPETGHTSLIGAEQAVTLSMDNGWTNAIDVGKLPDEELPVIVDMDPTVDPILLWAGKRSRRQVPLLPLQRNEIVAESRIGRIIDRAKNKASTENPQQPLDELIFSDLEKSLREEGKDKRVQFYTHDESWKNKLICGDSLQVMESLIQYEGLRGTVQMIYVDPPYGIKYDSNFQQRVDSRSSNDKDHADDVLTIKAFRDTWTLGIHSYLSYLEERLYLCRELLSDTGSIFLQINDTNVHLIRLLLDEVFGRSNMCGLIPFTTVTSQSSTLMPSVNDYLVWYAKSKRQVKFRRLYSHRTHSEAMEGEFKHYELPDGSHHRILKEHIWDPSTLPQGARLFRTNTTVSGEPSDTGTVEIDFNGIKKHPGDQRHWKVPPKDMLHLFEIGRLLLDRGPTRMFKQYFDDFPYVELVNNWGDLRGEQNRLYSTQTHTRVIERCIAMTTDPGDLVFDPTCGSGTAALSAEKLGRRWATCDTSRVAINVARKRLLSSVFEHYILNGDGPRSGFRYKTAIHRTLGSLAHDLEPDAVDLVDQPDVDKSAVRVTGPFEVMTLGRYSVDDWKGYLVDGTGDPGHLENYIATICRLYRKDAGLNLSSGVIHAVEDSAHGTLGISVGPISGRVSARQIYEAAGEAVSARIAEVHILGWAFEANVGEVKGQLDAEGRIRIELVMIRPDTLADGLKVTQPEMLFSPLALPDVDVSFRSSLDCVISLNGVALFDRKRQSTDYKHANSGYISAWYLDEDYDGDCFVDCQMFFDFKKKPAIERTLGIEVDSDEWDLRLSSDPFPVGGYRRAAVRVVDVYGNESTVVKALS
jgi:adenine-specific DNA-methyltransferase